MTLPTIIAELEEAERAANLNGDEWVVRYENIGPDDNPNLIAFLEEGSDEGRILCIDEDPRGEDLPSPALHYIALMRTHLPTLIEAVKRQGEALERIADPATYSHNLPSCCQHTFDDTCELFSDIARAALKETTDV